MAIHRHRPTVSTAGRALVLAIAAVLVAQPVATAAPAPAPPNDGSGGPAATLQVPSGEVATIETDDHGVSHIYADSAYALFYANGYVQARDRLFEMAVLRHVALGDSASFLGPGQLSSDLTVKRDLYTREELARQLREAPEDIQRSVQAYSDGVNRFIAEAQARDKMPSEFGLLGHAPEPWTPVDTAATVAYLIGFFGVAGGSELDTARTVGQLEETLGSEAAAYQALGDVNELEVDDSYTTIPEEDLTRDFGVDEDDLSASDPAVQEQLDLVDAAEAAEPWSRPADAGHDGAQAQASLDLRTYGGPAQELRMGPPAPSAEEGAEDGSDEVRSFGEVGDALPGFEWGSNALLVNGSKTSTGEPVMFGGPQTGYLKPSALYEIGLHGAGYDVTGVGVASAPGVVIGRTPDLAWSVTSGIDDQVDTVALELDPDDRHRYRWDGEWKRMDCREVTHRYQPTPATLATGAQPASRVLVQEVCRAGPKDQMPVVAWSPEHDVAFAQERTIWMEEADSAALWLRLGTVDTEDAFKETLRDFSFTFNFNLASPDGISYLHTGRVPVRDADLDPRLPRPAGSDNAWQGELVGDDLGTWAEDPSTGYYAQWNNAPVEGWTSGDNRHTWTGAHRVETLDRFVQGELEKDGAMSWSDTADVLEEAATHDPYARHLVPQVLGASTQVADDHPDVLGALQGWAADDYAWADADDDDRYDHEGHAVYDELARELTEHVLGDELDEETPTYQFEPQPRDHAADHGPLATPLILLEQALSGDTAHDWCDDVTTATDETCNDVVDAALRDTKADLAEDFGTSDVDAWHADEHTSEFVSLGAQSGEEIPMVNRGSWNQVVALGQGLDESKGVLPPGNSGLVTATDLAQGRERPNVGNQLPLYEDFAYKPLPITPDEVDQVTTSERSLLVPGLPAGPSASPG